MRRKEKEWTLWDKLRQKIGRLWYEIKSRVYALFTRNRKIKKTKPSHRRLKDGIFVYLVLLFPILQFCVFYIGVNVNSIVMAFQEYDVEAQNYLFAGWTNFKLIYTEFLGKSLFKICLKNSLLSFLWIQLLSPLVLFFTFFIYKKFVGYRFFKVVLFLPTIISTLITVTVYKYFSNMGIPWELEQAFGVKIGGLLSSNRTRYGAVMFYYMWLSFGTLMLMYLGCMNGISESIVESAKLEGATSMQEFFHITFPMIYPTFSTLFYTSIAGIFTNQINLFSIWGPDADSSLWTFGYYMYREVSLATESGYPYLSTLGILMTLVVAPLTFFFRWSLDKIGPSVE